MALREGVRSFTITLNGSVQDLLSAANSSAAKNDPVTDPAFQTIVFTPGVGNSGNTFISEAGFGTTSTNCGFILRTSLPVGVPIPAAVSPVRLSHFEVVGTAGDKLHILGVMRA
jgi:hypothetical protein